MARHVDKWARRQGLQCYRIYDRDLPNYPFSIDRYGDTLYICEFAKTHPSSDQDHENWMQECLQCITHALEAPAENVFLKKRERQKGANQYKKTGQANQFFQVTENGLRFQVNLSDYLDTGLFLDHRNTRQMVKLDSQGKRFLNLFAYTGAFTVYAIAGGALSTTTVDLSNTYLQWARENLRLNGWSDTIDKQHHFVQADVMVFLPLCPENSFDLVVLDPPTFSNSKRMQGILDIQRDHAALLNQTIKLCAPGGLIYFSTNQRSFQLYTDQINATAIKEITSNTIPADFRNKKIHRCFKIWK